MHLFEVGQTVHYLLPTWQRPTNKERLWKGRVLAVYPAYECMFIESLEPGYEQYKELIEYKQVIFLATSEKNV